MLHEQLTSKIISSAYEVHKILGHGFLENVYEKALAHELTLNNIPFEQQVKIEVTYKGKVIGVHRADFIIDNKVIVELKAAEMLIDEHKAQLLNYLCASKLEVGLLLNFGESELQIKRMVN